MEVSHAELERIIEVAYEKKLPLFIWGPPGIGKSYSVRQTAQRIAHKLGLRFDERDIEDGKFGFQDVRISQLDPSDLRGLPKVEGSVTRWLPPNWLPRNPQSRGILFFDELNLAPPSIQAACYQLILDRRLGDYRLPDGWTIIAAGNRLEDRANVFEMPAPLANRFLHVTLKVPSVEEWTEWALKHNIDHRIVGFLNNKQDALFKFDAKIKEKAFPTPRSWEFCSRLIEGVKEEQELLTLSSAAVGYATAVQFVAFIKLQETIDINKIFKEPERVKELDRPDLKYALVSLFADQFSKNRKKLDNIVATFPYLEPEYVVLTLRMLKNIDKSYLKANLGKSPVFRQHNMAAQYAPLLSD